MSDIEITKIKIASNLFIWQDFLKEPKDFYIAALAEEEKYFDVHVKKLETTMKKSVTKPLFIVVNRNNSEVPYLFDSAFNGVFIANTVDEDAQYFVDNKAEIDAGIADFLKEPNNYNK